MKKVVNNIYNLFTIKYGTLFVFTALFILSVFLYSKTINFDISGFDDESFSQISFSKYSLKDIFTKNVFLSDDLSLSNRPVFYRPVLILSFAIDSLIKQNVQVFHTTNILLHLACSFIFFVFLKRYFFNFEFSFLATVLFLLHPANIFTVAWIPGRNDSLLFIFFISSVIFLFEYINKDKLFFLCLHFVLFVLSLLTKETGLLIILIGTYYLLIKKDKRTFFIICLYAVTTTVFIIIYHKITPSIFSFDINKYFNHLICDMKFLFDYYFTLYFYNIHFSSYVKNINIVFGIFAVILSFVFALFSKLKKKEKIICFVMPVLLLSFSLILKPIFFQGNRLYIPLAFIIITFMSFIQNFTNKKLVYLFFLCISFYSVSVSFDKMICFQNPLIFFETIDKEKENYNVDFVSNLYSYNLLKFGNYEKAKLKINEVAQLTNYQNPFNLYMLSLICIYEKNFEQAANYLEEIINLDKKDICCKLVVCYEKLGNFEKSLYYYKELVYITGNEKDVESLLDKQRIMLND